MDATVVDDVFLLEGFRLDRNGGGLFRSNGNLVELGSRALDLLQFLVERSGQLVSKHQIMDAVWPGMAVEESNLTVQISALRKVLDSNRAGASCIQTVPGRGYRFVAAVRAAKDEPWAGPATTPMAPGGDDRIVPATTVEATTGATVARTFIGWSRRHIAWLGASLLGIAALLAFAAWFADGAPSSQAGSTAAPAGPRPVARLAPPFSPGEEALRHRLSLVVLPFENLGGDGLNDATVDAITDDVTIELAHLPILAVTARDSALAYKGRPADPKRIGKELGVRYVLQGSARNIDQVLRINAHIVSAETNEHVWAERFDAKPDTTEDIVRKIQTAARFRLVEAESSRSLRERPTNPDFADLLLRATYNAHNLAPNPNNRAEVISLYERAVQLDPDAVLALAGLAEALLDTAWARGDHPNNPAMVRRADELVRRAEELRPDSPYLMYVKLAVLINQHRCAELVPAARRAIALHPIVSSPYSYLGQCMLIEGRAADSIPQFEQSIRVNPRNPQVWNRYLFKAWALMDLTRYEDAVDSLNTALASLPSAASAETRANLYAWIATGQALASRLEEARSSAAEANRIWPMLTVRSFFRSAPAHSVRAAQIARDGLRLAGIRDHADEDADQGLEPDAVLHTNYQAPTPKSVPGARTIRTPDLDVLLDQRRPLVLDTKGSGKSIPGAVGLPGAGIGGAISDEYQSRLKQKMDQLTGRDRSRPMVTLGRNAERFEGRNLALRLAALGYTDVYWYRGGREAWEVAGLPETEVVAQEW